MEKITLDDVLSLTPDEILYRLRKNHQEKDQLLKAPKEPVVSSNTEELPEVPVVYSNPDLKISTIKKRLTGKFEDTDLTKGQIIDLGETSVQVALFEKASGRVRFKNLGNEETFSMPYDRLKGINKPMPFKKGDKILLEGSEYVIKGLNPASQNVVIEVDGKLRYVKVNKIKLA